MSMFTTVIMKKVFWSDDSLEQWFPNLLARYPKEKLDVCPEPNYSEKSRSTS